MRKNGKTDKMGKSLLFIDFDGVICDSVNECFVSSWLAYFGHGDREPASISLSDYRLFRKYRPLIRRGGDYVLLQRCIDMGIKLANQADFDIQAAIVGDAGMDAYHQQFYAVRKRLLDGDKAYWLRLNRIYAHVFEPLRQASGWAWILTTKEVSFVSEILASGGLPWDDRRIICSGKDRKIDVIEGHIGNYETAVFVDDQIDHFSGHVDPRITCYLAAWGYVQPAWLRAGIKVLMEEDFAGLVEGLR
ncbi:MAG: HAD family hydrolase [Spirochaetales bacterium]|nr:HAD family hydrolase [Spirochaetales bacterium]